MEGRQVARYVRGPEMAVRQERQERPSVLSNVSQRRSGACAVIVVVCLVGLAVGGGEYTYILSTPPPAFSAGSKICAKHPDISSRTLSGNRTTCRRPARGPCCRGR